MSVHNDKRNNTVELLAPAKNLECGIAAIDHGADAVYIGATNFGARHAASNAVSDIAELCRYAHQYGAKVYATLNTIIYDDELDEAVQLADELRTAGVDAILIQDMGLMARLAECLSETAADGHKMALHASTQTDNRSVEKVKWLHSLGFERVVLARELTAEDIAEIHREVPDVELEVFVHGALCVSYSGQCYASQHCFSRSANRGECAQMCRMRYKLEDADGNSLDDILPARRSEEGHYYLSLKDQCQIDNLEQIIQAGACSLKIEGRLKDVAYVKNVVGAYNERLNQLGVRRASWGRAQLTFTPDLNRSFNRGYTDYFLNGRHQDIASFFTPKAIGEYVGKVKKVDANTVSRGGRKSLPSLVVSSLAAFVNGDGLCYMTDEGELKGFRVNRAEGNRLFPHQIPMDIRPGMSLYRSQDQAFDQMLSGKTAVRTIPISMTMTMRGNALVLVAQGTASPHFAEAKMDIELQEAQKPQMENIRRQLLKLGGTIYTCDKLTVAAELDKVFIPSSLLAELRRQLVADLDASITDNFCRCGDVATAAQDSSVASAAQDGSDDAALPTDSYHQRYTYLYNIANDEARQFYAEQGLESAAPAMECSRTRGAERGDLLMQCRHCIRYSLGYCVKRGGRKPEWREPLTLRLADGRRFRLEFDCRNCQMNLLLD